MSRDPDLKPAVEFKPSAGDDTTAFADFLLRSLGAGDPLTEFHELIVDCMIMNINDGGL